MKKPRLTNEWKAGRFDNHEIINGLRQVAWSER